MSKKKTSVANLHDPPTLYALVSALPSSQQAEDAWAEYATVGRVYERLAKVLALIGMDEARIPAIIQSGDQFFEHAIASVYRENIESQGYAWLPELAKARRAT